MLSRSLCLAWLACFLMISSEIVAQGPATIRKPDTATNESKKVETEPEHEKVVKPFLWKIESEKPSYLFGTIHVSDERVLELHPLARKAFEDSDTLFLEVKPADALAQMKALILPFGDKLEDLLDKETLARLDKQLEQINPVFAGKHRPNYRVWAWPLVLPNLESQLKNPKMMVLDFKLGSIAADQGKYVGSLEDPASQMKGLDRLTKEEQAIFLRDALTSMEDADEEAVDYEAQITNLYLSGNARKVQMFFDEEIAGGELPDELIEKILDAILYSRNATMAETIRKTLKSHANKSHFFAAGTAHFVGPKSVQAYLKETGQKISRVRAGK